MTVMVVDKDWTALRRTAEAITKENAAVTVMLKAGEAEAAQFAMYHPVDLVFIRAGLFSEGLARKIQSFQPMTECHVLGAGQDPTPFLVPYVL